MKYYIADKGKEKMINDLGEKYKDLLLETVLHNANETDIDKLDPALIEKFDKKAKSVLRRSVRNRDPHRIFMFFSLLGMLCASVGCILPQYVYKALNYDFKEGPLIFTVFTVVSLAISIFGTISYFLIDHKENRYRKTSYEIFNKWEELEKTIIKLNPDGDKIPLSTLIDTLEDQKVLEYKDVDMIKQLIKERNKIAHTGTITMPFEQYKKTLLGADLLISKLKKEVEHSKKYSF